MTESEEESFDPIEHFRGHVLGKLGLGFVDEGGGPAVTLEPAPALLDGGGHVSFGVLGILFDLASSTAFRDRPQAFVHADIAVHRLRPPSGTMLATTTLAREGRRTAIVDILLHDRSGALVATSTQEIVFRGPAPVPGSDRSGMEEIRARMRQVFDGVCRLGGPIEQELGIRAEGPDAWAMDLAPGRTNGFGGLHGGVATTLVDRAAAGIVAGRWARNARTVSAEVRYLAPALVGPFVARPEVRFDDAAVAVVRVPVHDIGAGDQLVILADAHVACA